MTFHLKSVLSRIKYFYIGCIISIKLCTDYKNVKKILKHIIVLSLNKYNDERCENSRQYLNEISSNFNKSDPEHTEQKPYDRDFSDIAEENNTLLDKWFSDEIDNENLYTELNDTSNLDTNFYYFQEILNLLKHLLKKLLMWSNVLNSNMDSESTSPSSSNVESYFKSIKTLLLSNKRERVDSFLIRHYEFIAGKVKHV